MKRANAATPPDAARLDGLARIVVRRFKEDRCMQVASSLTYTSLLAFVPIVTVALTAIGALGIFSNVTMALRAFILDHLVPASADVIVAYTQQFVTNAGRLTALGLGFLAATSVVLVLTIDRAFNSIWRVARPRPLVQRVVMYVTLIVLGPVVVGATLSFTSWLVGETLGVTRALQGIVLLFVTLAPIVFTSAAFTLLYRTVPNSRVEWRDAAVGGLLSGLVFEAARRAFALYISNFATYDLLYGAFAAVPVFLLWVYVSWLVVIFGAVVVAAIPEWRQLAASAQTIRREAPAARSTAQPLSRS